MLLNPGLKGAALIILIFSNVHCLTDYSNKFNNGNDIVSHMSKQNDTFNITTASTTVPNEERKLSDEVYDEITKKLILGDPAPRLFGLLEQIPMPNVYGYFTSAKEMLKETSICVICRSVIDAILRYYETHKSEQGLRELAYSLCIQLQIEPDEVCAGVIDLNIPTITYIINNTEGLTSDTICGVVLQSSGCSQDDAKLEWTIDVDLGNKPNITDNIRTVAAEDPVTIVQVTDIHHDPIYKPDGNAVCGEPMCCRSKQGNPETPAAAAGYWGDYRYCDLSWHAFEDALQQIKKNHEKIDYIYMTGDIVDHAVWDTSIEKNTETIKKVLKEIKNTFADVPVYPILGNHEPSPLNVYAPKDITETSVSTNWLYELIAEEWSAWLPADTKETILQGGYYTVPVKPGFRIIGLNNNLCYTFNWWLLYNMVDPAGQLKWLAETLTQAEKDGEKVHILGHIPPGDSCQKTWSREYRKIIDRFEGTVTAQFNGHTHKDEFEIFYSLEDPSRAINIAFNGGSVTQYEFLNSNYKIYTMDSSTYDILDGEAWTYNLTTANSQGNESAPEWFQLYSYKKDYELESLSPSEFDKLAHKMAVDKSFLQKYARYYVKDADPSLICDDTCLKNKLCDLATCQVGDTTQCDELIREFQSKK
ncbi:hypothetical protein L9F63_013126 [Diploptera punctata]|uniref:Sphingomyelin phosphodiesterase n=1 Tax=Diploptera punctata TaxID=6984 RepID=A0AAD8AAY8_DIPPU|nr:hypothetical protein L9F63_013126 [Diploptera punctata]